MKYDKNNYETQVDKSTHTLLTHCFCLCQGTASDLVVQVVLIAESMRLQAMMATYGIQTQVRPGCGVIAVRFDSWIKNYIVCVCLIYRTLERERERERCHL